MTYCVVLSTTDSQEEADNISARLLEKRIAACVQTSPIQSAYHWKGKIERTGEIRLLIKTKDELYTQVEKIIKDNHSYKTPQIVKLQISDGLSAYLDWIDGETK